MTFDAFAEDEALDWLVELVELRAWSDIRVGLGRLEAGGWSRFPGEAVAVGELIAAGRGRPRATLPAAVESFLDRVDGYPTADDADRAAALVERVLEHAAEDAARRDAIASLVSRLRW